MGRWLIALFIRLIEGALTRQKIDPTLIRYIHSAVAALLNIVLVVAILGFFGVETTSFAALLAAAGIAIGMAWSEFRRWRVPGGPAAVQGRRFRDGRGHHRHGRAIGLFATLNTPDNVKTIVGNGKIYGDTIQNFSANPYRRVELTAQLAHDVDPEAAVGLLKPALAKVPNVLADPAPDVEILTFNLAGPVLAVRPDCPTTSTTGRSISTSNKLIRELFRAPAPGPRAALFGARRRRT